MPQGGSRPVPIEVVSNTSPLLSLQGIERLSLLKEMYGKIFVPEAVYREIENGKGKGIYADLATIDWISIQPIQEFAIQPLALGLGAGEAAAITLCMERKADLLILDDKHARRCALSLDLPIIGTIGVLLAAKRKGLITTVKPLLKDMQLSSAWVKPDLVQQALVLAGEE